MALRGSSVGLTLLYARPIPNPNPCGRPEPGASGFALAVGRWSFARGRRPSAMQREQRMSKCWDSRDCGLRTEDIGVRGLRCRCVGALVRWCVAWRLGGGCREDYRKLFSYLAIYHSYLLIESHLVTLMNICWWRLFRDTVGVAAGRVEWDAVQSHSQS